MSTGADPTRTEPSPDAVVERCAICGHDGPYAAEVPEGATLVRREHERCPGCRAQLRYQGQALAVLDWFRARHPDTTARSIAEAVTDERFAGLAIYEPGTRGPFRRYLRPLGGYVRSEYNGDVAPGTNVYGLRSEDLMALTFDDASFDLVLTSDVFEHVRHPMRAFAEVHRALAPGGAHIFTIPAGSPMRAVTVARVDVSGPDDVHVLPAHHHAGHLVYNDFGADLLDELAAIGAPTTPVVHRCATVDGPVDVTTFTTRKG